MSSTLPIDAFRTTLVGSYPVPRWVFSSPGSATLRDAMQVVLKTQELAGLDVLVDGEMGRFDFDHPETNGMIEYFLQPMEGVNTVLSQAETRSFQEQAGMHFRVQPAGIVTGPLAQGGLDLLSDYESLRQLTFHPVKFTVTSPYMLAKTVYDTHYASLPDLTMALAEVLAQSIGEIEADILQVDEANLPGYPADIAWAHEPLNVVLDAIQKEKALHLCFGNYGGQSIQSGFWRDLVPFFNSLRVDTLILEFARRGYGELEAFRDVRTDIALGIGVVDIKDLEIETPEVVARRIEEAVKIIGADRIAWVHPDCGFWMLPRNVADGKMRQLVAGRDLFYSAGS